MDTAILLAVAASLCTATSSVCQRIGAKSSQTRGFDAGLVFRLARRPVWLLGIASMIGGFVLQLIALHFGALALVQPILAAELVFVFGYLAVAGSGRVKPRDWLTAAAMSVGIGVFLRVASPSGGRLHAPGSSWLVAGLATVGVVLLALAVAFGLGAVPAHRGRAGPPCWERPPGSRGDSWPPSSRNSARTLMTAPGPSSPAGRCTCSSPPGRPRCCSPHTPWRPGRWRPPSPGSPSSIRWRPACSGCSCSASTSGPGPLTWPVRRWRWPWSSPPRRSSAIAATSPARTAAAVLPRRRRWTGTVRHPAQQPRRDGYDNLAPAPARQRLPRKGDEFTITVAHSSLRDTHMAGSEDGCRMAQMPAEPGRGRPGTCGGGDSRRSGRVAVRRRPPDHRPKTSVPPGGSCRSLTG